MQSRPMLRSAALRQSCRTRLRGEVLEPRLALTAGTLDGTFGISDGKVEIHPGTSGFVDEGWSVATQADSKVVVAGTAWSSADQISFALVRYNADGTLDTTFGTGGQVITPVTTSIEQGRIYGLIVEPDQKIVVSGEDGSNMLIARYNTNGTLDSTFGTGGIVTLSSIGQYFTGGKGEALAVQANGKYVITGYSVGLDFQGTWPVVRLNHDGSVDTTFGTAGLADGPTFPGGGLFESWDVLVQSDQKIVVVGDTGVLSNQWEIVRYNSDGTLDTTFGTGGVATVPFSVEGQQPFQVAEQADGKLLIAGAPFQDASETQSGFELMRLNTNGTLDSTFNGGQPIAVQVAGQADSQSFQVAVLASGKILLAGHVEKTAGTGVGNFAVLRYNANGTLDTTFGNAGTAMTNFDETADNWGLDFSVERVGMAIEPNGGIVVMSEGELTISDPDYSWLLARFTDDSTQVVLPPPPTNPWQNPSNPLDVDNSGTVSPADALDIINFLNTSGAGVLSGTPGNPPIYYDVNGDGSVTPNDALDVIDYLNAQAAAQAVAAPAALAAQQVGSAIGIPIGDKVTAALGIADQASTLSGSEALLSANSNVGSNAASSATASAASGAMTATQPAALAAAGANADTLSSVYAAAGEDEWSPAGLAWSEADGEIRNSEVGVRK